MGYENTYWSIQILLEKKDGERDSRQRIFYTEHKLDASWTALCPSTGVYLEESGIALQGCKRSKKAHEAERRIGISNSIFSIRRC